MCCVHSPFQLKADAHLALETISSNKNYKQQTTTTTTTISKNVQQQFGVDANTFCFLHGGKGNEFGDPVDPGFNPNPLW